MFFFSPLPHLFPPSLSLLPSKPSLPSSFALPPHHVLSFICFNYFRPPHTHTHHPSPIPFLKTPQRFHAILSLHSSLSHPCHTPHLHTSHPSIPPPPSPPLPPTFRWLCGCWCGHAGLPAWQSFACVVCLTFIQIQRKGSVHPIRVSRAFLIKARGKVTGGMCLCAFDLVGTGASEQSREWLMVWTNMKERDRRRWGEVWSSAHVWRFGQKSETLLWLWFN